MVMHGRRRESHSGDAKVAHDEAAAERELQWAFRDGPLHPSHAGHPSDGASAGTEVKPNQAQVGTVEKCGHMTGSECHNSRTDP